MRGSKVEPGDGSRLTPVTGWQWLWRGQFVTSHGGAEYAIDVDYFDWKESCDLYRDGVQVARAGSPATFPLSDEASAVDDGSRIEATMSWYGMSRAHLVTPSGEVQLEPAHGTAEAWRASLDEERPGLSRLLAAASLVVLLVALALEVPQLLQMLTSAGWWGAVSDWRFTSPVSLPAWVNTVLTIGGVLAGLERALRLRHHWLLDD